MKTTFQYFYHSDHLGSASIVSNTAPYLAKLGYSMGMDFMGENYVLTPSDIIQAFTPGKGPILEFSTAPGSESSAGGYNKSNAGKLYTGPMVINEQLLIDLENALTPEDQQAVLLALTSVIIHEYSEYFGDDSQPASAKINAPKDIPLNIGWGARECQRELYQGVGYGQDYINEAKTFIKNTNDKSVVPNVPMF
jgi:hypothetical protein